jgi:hypothetical protein
MSKDACIEGHETAKFKLNDGRDIPRESLKSGRERPSSGSIRDSMGSMRLKFRAMFGSINDSFRYQPFHAILGRPIGIPIDSFNEGSAMDSPSERLGRARFRLGKPGRAKFILGKPGNGGSFKFGSLNGGNFGRLNDGRLILGRGGNGGNEGSFRFKLGSDKEGSFSEGSLNVGKEKPGRPGSFNPGQRGNFGKAGRPKSRLGRSIAIFGRQAGEKHMASLKSSSISGNDIFGKAKMKSKNPLYPSVIAIWNHISTWAMLQYSIEKIGSSTNDDIAAPNPPPPPPPMLMPPPLLPPFEEPILIKR